MQAFAHVHAKGEVELVTHSRQVSRQCQRTTGKKPSPYFLLKLKEHPTRKVYTDSQKTGIKRSHHFVRGHFRTYSADRPMGRGKFVGTVFVRAHQRGDLAEGQTSKGYYISLD
jgi:hypothetical protein